MRVAFLIRSLHEGGAERQLATLIAHLDPARIHPTVLTFYPGGRFADEIRARGVEVVCLGKRGRWDTVRFLADLRRALRRARADLLHTFLETANAYGALVAPLVPGLALVWGIRSSAMELAHDGPVERIARRAQQLLARRADLIIYNSAAGRAHYEAHGVRGIRAAVVPNGFDPEAFRRDEAGRRRLRAEWGFTDEERVVGMVARIDPIKDHATFLEAAARLAASVPRARFVCVGAGEEDLLGALRARASRLGLEGRVHFAGSRRDLGAVYSAFDVACLTSLAEGFPNVIAEAMLCGVPCASTAAGDAVEIVGDTGAVVPVGDAPALAAALVRLVAAPASLGEAARARIVTRYSGAVLAERTAALLESVRR